MSPINHTTKCAVFFAIYKTNFVFENYLNFESLLNRVRILVNISVKLKTTNFDSVKKINILHTT